MFLKFGEVRIQIKEQITFSYRYYKKFSNFARKFKGLVKINLYKNSKKKNYFSEWKINYFNGEGKKVCASFQIGHNDFFEKEKIKRRKKHFTIRKI